MSSVRQKLTVPEVAQRWGVSQDTVRRWIKSGELRYTDAAGVRGGRPHYVIDVADLAAFEARRSGGKTPTPKRRRKKSADVITFF